MKTKSNKWANTSGKRNQLDMPGERGDIEAMKEYIAGKNSSQAQRDLLHTGSGLDERSYDPGYEKGEKGSREVS